MFKQTHSLTKYSDALRAWLLNQDLILVFLTSTFLLILIIALLIIDMIR